MGVEGGTQSQVLLKEGRAPSLRGAQASVGDRRLGRRGTPGMQKEDEEKEEGTGCLPEMGTWGGMPRLWPS